MCGVDLACCGGRCAACCADVDCHAQSACVPGLCMEGECRHGEAFSYPDWTGTIEPLASPRRAIAMGKSTLLVMERSIAAVGPLPGGGEGVLSTQSFPGRIADVETSFGLVAALVEPEWGGLEIHLVDLSLPRWPRLTVVAVLSDLAAMDLEGFLLFAVSPAGLWIVSVGDVVEPKTLAEIALGCERPSAVHARATGVAVGCEDGRTVYVDVRDPTKPAIVEAAAGASSPAAADPEPPAWIARFDRIADVAFEHRSAAVAFEGGGILIVDAADPTDPRAVRSILHESRPVAIAWAAPGVVAIADEGGRVVLVDAGGTQPGSRVIEYEASTGAKPLDVASAGDRLAITDSDGMVAFVDHLGLEKPAVLGGIALAAASRIAAFAGDTLFVASADQAGGRVQSIPVPADGSEPGPATDPWEAAWPAIAIDCAIVADSPVGCGGPLRLRKLEHGVPDGKEEIVAGAGAALVAIHEGRPWTVCGSGLMAVEPAFPGAAIMHASGHVQAAAGATSMIDLEGGVALVGPLALLIAEATLPPVAMSSARDAGVQDSPSPFLASAWAGRTYFAKDGRLWRDQGKAIDLPGPVMDLAAGKSAIAAMMAGAVAVLGVDESGNPVMGSVVALPDGSEAHHVEIAGKAACVAAGAAGMVVLDASTPVKASVTGKFAEHGTVTSVASRKKWCFGLAADGKVLAVSVVDPRDPRLAGTLDETGGEPASIWSAGDEIAAITGDGHLALLAVEAPPVSGVVTSVSVPGLDPDGPLGLARSGDIVALAGPVTWLVNVSEDGYGIEGVYASPWDQGSIAMTEDGSLIGAGGHTVWTLDLSCLR